ncbi:MAG: ABC transporter permease [Anaerolineales bacterium]|nr:ABC transporter permease [Anaerolineales bacterium]
MARYLVRRICFMVVSLALVTVVVFAVTEILPGDVATMILGKQATPDDLAALREQLGLNRPPHVRYFDWLSGLLQGDLGESLRFGVPIAPLLWQRLRNSAVLAAFTLTIGVPSGVVLGVLAGLARDRWPDHLISIGSLTAVSLPEFVTAVFLILVFSSWLGWLPPSSLIDAGTNPLNAISHLILPTATLVVAMWAHIARMTRTNMGEVMGSNYIRTAILKGLPMRKVVLEHALKNALLPTISIVAMNVGWLMGGLIIVESVYAYPGLGRLLFMAIRSHDVPLLQVVTLVIAFIYTTSNLMADLLYKYSNPRIRYRGGPGA